MESWLRRAARGHPDDRSCSRPRCSKFLFESRFQARVQIRVSVFPALTNRASSQSSRGNVAGAVGAGSAESLGLRGSVIPNGGSSSQPSSRSSKRFQPTWLKKLPRKPAGFLAHSESLQRLRPAQQLLAHHLAPRQRQVRRGGQAAGHQGPVVADRRLHRGVQSPAAAAR